jgi:hypothetical protein
LSDLSPVVQSLAARQFDDLVKRVRVFVAPHLREALRDVDIPRVLREQLARQGG